MNTLTLLKQNLDNLFWSNFWGKYIFSTPQMPIYVNKREDDVVDLIFFHQKKCSYYLGNYKNYQPEILQS